MIVFILCLSCSKQEEYYRPYIEQPYALGVLGDPWTISVEDINSAEIEFLTYNYPVLCVSLLPLDYTDDNYKCPDGFLYDFTNNSCRQDFDFIWQFYMYFHKKK